MFGKVDDPARIIQINDVNREKEPDGMDSPGRPNPKAFVTAKGAPAKKSTKAAKRGVRRADPQMEERFSVLVINVVLFVQAIFLTKA
jgi:hypothetical protein